MADDCENSFGGRVSITADDQVFTPSEADIELEISNISVEAKANGDGSACFMAKPELYGCKIKFRNNSGIVWNTTLRKCKLDVTIKEIDNNRTHLFTAARIVGRPTLNLSTGEVDGCEIRGDRYQAI
ncbi:hypothetical protein [Rhodopseudomonas sp. BR0G17]|uniref:hypothetical protein n=1 Tax=Rhodopseudomonas sp. BR0G17 TaxID=2269368 RepID=UPI0013DF9903|nr:hypothetical protein [Rhodopseudomonas sp. BR0G17]NEW96644.1 hypothetical protein [Rhodopseudomonas sp. BR0G17]